MHPLNGRKNTAPLTLDQVFVDEWGNLNTAMPLTTTHFKTYTPLGAQISVAQIRWALGVKMKTGMDLN